VKRDVLVKEQALVAEIMVNFTGAARAGVRNERQEVNLHAMAPQTVNAPQDFGRSARAVLSSSIAIVRLGRTVQAHADQEAILREVPRQFVRDQSRLGLRHVGDDRAWTAVFLLKIRHPAEEFAPEQRRFPALLDESVGRLVCGHVAQYKPRQTYIRHAMLGLSGAKRSWSRSKQYRRRRLQSAETGFMSSGYEGESFIHNLPRLDLRNSAH